MHEMSIAQNIVDIVVNEADKHEVGRVLTVHLRVGELSAVVPSSLLFCWDLVTRGTLVEGAVLTVEEVPVRARCRDCGREFRVENHRFVCPACAGLRVEMISGRELSVQEIEVE